VDVSSLAHEPDLATRARHLASALAKLRGTRIARSDQLSDDITDPIGGDLERFQRVGEDIANALLPLLGALARNPVMPG
jgi:hypothetical protein